MRRALTVRPRPLPIGRCNDAGCTIASKQRQQLTVHKLKKYMNIVTDVHEISAVSRARRTTKHDDARWGRMQPASNLANQQPRRQPSMRLLIAVVLLLAGDATGDVFGEEVGIAKLVKTWAYLTPDGDRRRPLFQRDGVQAPATIETIDKGALHVRFTDGTDLRLGSASRAQLGEIRVDGRDPSLPLILERGAFRLITGRSPPSAFELTTPTGSSAPISS